MDAHFIDPGSTTDAYRRASVRLADARFADALWSRRLDVWPSDPAARASVSNRLGWLGALDFIARHLDRLKAFGGSVRDAGFTDIVLLGMGGSSLAPEVLRRVLGVAPGYPRFRMLDSVDPAAVRDALEPAASSLFILASKSGSTIEPNVMAAEAQRRVLAAGHQHWGPRFVAITDEGTPFHRRAVAEGFRDVFVNPSDIGGRYSALSYFGMVPAALMGIDLERLLAQAREMEAACRRDDVAANPGLSLGALIAGATKEGRDKLALVLPPELESFGLWAEQLIAESTGKSGTGVVPFHASPAETAEGPDCIAVELAYSKEAGTAAIAANAPEVPRARLVLSSPYDIGAEFLRWEVATATVGMLLGINPFDEPNVQQAKDATRALLDIYRARRALPAPEPMAALGGARFSASAAALAGLNGTGVDAFLSLMGTRDYFSLLAYLPPDGVFDDPLRAFREAVATKSGRAAMFGYGPRYLHSTGQLHKGGPNTGVFIVLTADPDRDLDVPGEPFTFGVLERAQALGDFQSLDRAGRRALYVHLSDRHPAAIEALATRLCAVL